MNRSTGSRRTNRMRLYAQTLVEDRIYRSHHDNDLSLLLLAIRDEVYTSPIQGIPGRVTTIQRAWCRFAVALVVEGFVRPDCTNELFDIQMQHLDDVDRGEISIPRAGGAVVFRIRDQMTSDLALSLRVILRRGHGDGRNRLGPYPDDGYVVPGRLHPAEPLSSFERARWLVRLEAWLTALGDRAGVHTNLRELGLLARGRLANVYTSPIAGVMLGFHLPNPAPVTQRHLLAEYRTPIRLALARQQAEQLKAAGISAATTVESKPQRQQPAMRRPHLSRDLVQLNTTIKFYSGVDKLRAGERRARTGRALAALAESMRQTVGLKQRESWPDVANSAITDEMSTGQIDALNVALIALWMRALLQRSPATVDAYRHGCLTIVRLMPTRPIFGLGNTELLHLIEGLPLSRSSRLVIGKSYASLYRFLRERLGISTPVIEWWRYAGARRIRAQHLLTQRDVEKLIAVLAALGPSGHSAVVAVLLTYYFGLRAHEVCQLRVGQIRLHGAPWAFVRNAKGGRPRSIELGHDEIPPDVLQFLQHYVSNRLAKSGGDPAAFLLVSRRGNRRTPAWFRTLLQRAMDVAEIHVLAGGKRSVVHAIRHAAANRWWAMGLPLREIALRLGHKSPETTVATYLHIGAFLQMERAAQTQNSSAPPQWTFTGLAALLGVTPRAVRLLLSAAANSGSVNDEIGRQKLVEFGR